MKIGRNEAILFLILESRKPRKYINTRVLLYPVTAHRTRCDDDARGLPSYGSQPVIYHVQFNSKRRPLLPASPLNRKIPGPFSPTASKHRFRPNYRPTEIVANLFAAGLYRVGSVSPRDEPLISRGPGVGGGWGTRVQLVNRPRKRNVSRRKKRHEPRHRSARDERAAARPITIYLIPGSGQLRSSSSGTQEEA